MDDRLTQARRWRERAEEMRTVAEAMRDKTARTDLLSAASNWEKMARKAEAGPATRLRDGPALLALPTIVACRCGARYSRSMVKGKERERDRFECFVCQAVIEIWDGSEFPQFELISRPDRPPASGR
jgi:hypothetical protein